MDQLPFAAFSSPIPTLIYSALLLTPSNINALHSYGLFNHPPATDQASRPPSPLTDTEAIIMPGKHVHFDEKNIFYSPSATPSPTFSLSSLPSSSGPFTPPQFSKHLGPVQIHPLLAYHPYVFPINYNVSRTPNAASANIQASPIALDSYHRAEAATSPSMKVLYLHSNLLPWNCEIRASVYPYITVEDVLCQLYRFLRTPATSDEYKAVPDQYTRDTIAGSYHTRCKRASSPEEYAGERNKGLKRVDFLMEHTTFMGLSSTNLGPDMWVLNLQ